MLCATTLLVWGLSCPARAEEPPIRIGEINSYTGPSAAFTQSYRKGFEMAVDEVNASGGVLGRKLEILFRDDNYSPADGVRLANELILQDKVDLLAGTFFSIDNFPKWLQYFCKILPLTYLNDALRKVSFDGATLWDIRMDVLALLISGVVVYAIASKVFKWE